MTVHRQVLASAAAGIIMATAAVAFADSPASNAPTIATYTQGLTPSPHIGDITLGPTGDPWFAEPGADKIGRISPDGTISEFPVPTPNAWPIGITAGPDGDIWFTELNASKIGRISPSTGAIVEWALPPSERPWHMTTGPDGDLWFTEVNAIGRMTPAGEETQFPLSTDAEGITAGRDGNLWFTEPDANSIGRITTTGVVTEFPVDEVPTTQSCDPTSIVAGPDGNLWFTVLGFGAPCQGQVGRITPSGAVTMFPLSGPVQGPDEITSGPDGSLWFTEAFSGDVAEMTTAGHVTEYHLLPPNTPYGIAADNSGNLWVTAAATGYEVISKITPSESTISAQSIVSQAVKAAILAGQGRSYAATVPGTVLQQVVQDYPYGKTAVNFYPCDHHWPAGYCGEYHMLATYHDTPQVDGSRVTSAIRWLTGNAKPGDQGRGGECLFFADLVAVRAGYPLKSPPLDYSMLSKVQPFPGATPVEPAKRGTVEPGDILMTNVRGSPQHTAVVIVTTDEGLLAVDSNQLYDEKIRLHYMPWGHLTDRADGIAYYRIRLWSQNAATQAWNDMPTLVQVGSVRAYTEVGEQTLSAAPVLSNGRVLVPLDFFSNVLGADVSWDSATRQATVSMNGDEVVTPVSIQQGRPMVLASAVGEGLGYTVRWIAGDRGILIAKGV